jgi:hypothetical protein
MRDFEIAIPSDCISSEKAESNQGVLMLMQRVLKAKIVPSTEFKFEDTKIIFPPSSTVSRVDPTTVN